MNCLYLNGRNNALWPANEEAHDGLTKSVERLAFVDRERKTIFLRRWVGATDDADLVAAECACPDDTGHRCSKATILHLAYAFVTSWHLEQKCRLIMYIQKESAPPYNSAKKSVPRKRYAIKEYAQIAFICCMCSSDLELLGTTNIRHIFRIANLQTEFFVNLALEASISQSLNQCLIVE